MPVTSSSVKSYCVTHDRNALKCKTTPSFYSWVTLHRIRGVIKQILRMIFPPQTTENIQCANQLSKQ